MDSKIEQSIAHQKVFDIQPIDILVGSYRQKLEDCASAKELGETIINSFIDFSNAYIALGNSESRKLKEISDANELGIYLLHFRLPETFKELLFLHRDVLLQLAIAKHKNLEGLVAEKVLEDHFVESKEVLLKAVDHFREKMLFEYNGAVRLTQTKVGISAKLKHHQNPWEIYEAQFSSIQEQIIQIDTATNSYTKAVQIFDGIRKHTHDICALLLKEDHSFVSAAETGVEKLKEIKEVSEIDEFLSWLDEELSKLDLDNQLQENFTAFLESKTQTLGSITLPIETSEGLLLTKKIELDKATQKWLDYTPLPYLIELFENRLHTLSYYRLSLLNLQNSLQLVKTTGSLETLPNQLEGQRNIGDTLKSHIAKQEKVIKEIQGIMDADFLATNIYHQEDFLEVSLQSSLAQLTSQRVSLFDGFRKKLRKFFSRVGSKYEQNVLDNSAQKLERSMRCIEHRMFKEVNAHYDTLFLNKNFVGDLFLVAREEAEATLLRAITKWRSGAFKSILVLGNPLSGKSTFIEKMAKDHFGKHILFLNVDSDIVVEGRKFKTSKDLAEALNHVKKNIYNTRPVVIIDDIELWRDKEHTLIENVQAAIRFIESESEHVFVIIATSQMMKNHLDKRSSFSNTFSTLIDIEQATFQTIYKAILLRNGASHRTLIDNDGNPLTDKQIEQSIQKLCRTFNYNLGEVLQAWTYGTKMTTDNKVIFKDWNSTFEDFFTTSEVIILKYLVLYSYVNEIILKEFMGKRFDKSYRSGLRRLINTKVLLREENGNLKINSVLKYDIRELLKYRGILK
ncbi:MAG: AAA family ATPase [Maribacter sp.]|uniref:AAA family ATPase n=1 Tax=Maribacter sp. TaxID=1897614 RepID=UPI003C75EC2C